MLGSAVRRDATAATKRRRADGQGKIRQRTKPHVNVGTIGHIDHGKTTLTAAIMKVRVEEGPGEGDQRTRTSPRAARFATTTKIVTIAVSHVEYESAEAPLRARRLPRPRRLHQEHDHGRGADGRRDPGGVARSTGRCRRPASTCFSRARSVCQHIVVALNKCDAVDDPEMLELVEMEVRELLNKYKFHGDTRRSCASRALPALQGDAKWDRDDQGADRRARRADPGAGSRHRQAVPDGDRGRVLDQGPRHGRHGPHRARHGQGQRRGRDPRLPRHRRRRSSRASRCSASCSTRARRATTSAALLRGIEKDDVERGQILCKPGSHQDAQEVRGRGLRPEEGRGRPSHAVLHATTVRSSTCARPT